MSAAAAAGQPAAHGGQLSRRAAPRGRGKHRDRREPFVLEVHLVVVPRRQHLREGRRCEGAAGRRGGVAWMGAEARAWALKLLALELRTRRLLWRRQLPFRGLVNAIEAPWLPRL